MNRSLPRLIAPEFGNLLHAGMTQENRPPSDAVSTDSQPATETGNISERVQALRQKASQLSETLDRVEKSLEQTTDARE